MANQWFRFYGSEFLSDPKITQLTASERSCWITLLCLASQTKDGIVRFLSEAQLLSTSGVQENISVLPKFEKLDMIKLCNGDVTITNWAKRQYSESINRVREYRKKQKSNGEETTEQNRTERKKEQKELPVWLDKQIWSEWKQHRKEIKKTLTPLTEKKQLALLEAHRFDHVAIIQKSIQNGWAGLFPLKGEKSRSYSGSEFSRDKEKIAARMGDIDYENKIKLDNELSRIARQKSV